MIEEMPFCIKDVLERPLFKRANLIAGKNGWYREVRWVHILEITHASPYVSKNDLILTTGLWLKQSVQAGLDYMTQIIEHETAGLCIEFGTTIDEIPDEIIDLCNANDFPLILFKQPIRFEEITQDIHAFLINRHFELLKRLEAFSQKQQQLIVQSSNIPAILRLLYQYSSGQVVYFSSVAANHYVPSVSPETADSINAFFNEKTENGSKIKETQVLEVSETLFFLIQPVICFGQVFSYIGISLHQSHPTEYMTLLLDYTTKAVATILLRTQFLDEKILSNQNELIQDLLSRRIDSEEQARLRMGLSTPGENSYLFIGGIIEIEHNVIEAGPERMEATNQDILVLIRSLLKKSHLHHLVMMKNNQIYLLCAKERITDDSSQLLKEKIKVTVEGLFNFIESVMKRLNFRVGFGKTGHKLIHIWQSFKEAYQVIEVTRSVSLTVPCCFYDDLGVYQILKALPQPFLSEFVNDHLGRLIDYDEKHHLSLIETLDCFFRHMGSKGETAKSLFIHRQTLYNRLDKIREILGADFFEPHKRYCLEMALLANDLLKRKNQ